MTGHSQIIIFILCIIQLLPTAILSGILYPKSSETRQVVPLDGLWDFVASNTTDHLRGFTEFWYKKDFRDLPINLELMPVPASYNDITTNWKLRDHVGLVWYQKKFFIPKSWATERVWIRFGSVSYAAQVWINGNFAVSHEIGKLPFQKDITDLLKYGKENQVTVVCDNTLLVDTIPQGKVEEIESGRLVQTYTFDFFNYAGIDRPVYLYTTPKTYVDDITTFTDIEFNNTGIVHYNVSVATVENPSIAYKISLMDKHGNVVAKSDSYSENLGYFKVPDANLWWPYLMSPTPGYLYKLVVEILDTNGDLIDKYIQPIGIRTLKWNTTSFLINDKPVYLHGFGRHEDSDIRGKGFDWPLVTRDHNLIKWVGANAYRTSHYPYAEEIMDLADEIGIMIIDECPSVDTVGFSESLLAKHKQSLTELIQRDKNRPAVVMWSGANEPRTQFAEAKDYFRAVMDHIRTLDVTRPRTIVVAQNVNADYSSEFVDIVSFNRYNGWYQNAGALDIISAYVEQEATDWHERFKKPVIMQEYGADTLEGLHFEPTFIWSEEYQVQLMSKHFVAFDRLRAKGFFIGEFIWNFADFKTNQGYTRVGGNKKGIFTRNRQPKASAFHLRRRYWSLAKELYNATVPDDLYTYVSSIPVLPHDEL